SHPPPTTGNYPYSASSVATGGTWYPGSPNPPTPFPAVGETYIDPVFGQRVRRLSNLQAAANGDSVNYAWNGFWNADASYRIRDNGTGSPVAIINAVTGAVLRDNIPFDLNNDTNEFDPNFRDVWFNRSGSTTLSKFLVSDGTNTVIKDFGVGNTLGSLGGT